MRAASVSFAPHFLTSTRLRTVAVDEIVHSGVLVGVRNEMVLKKSCKQRRDRYR